MQCKRARKHLTAFLDGELEESLQARVEEHLTGCAACRSERQALERVRRALDGLEVPGFEPSLSPEALLDRARSRTGRMGRRERTARGWSLPGIPVGLRPVVAVGTLGLFLGVVWVMASLRSIPVPPGQEVFMLEQMELFEDLDLIRNLAVLEELGLEGGGEGGVS